MSLYSNSSFNPVLSEALNKIGENRFVGTQILPIRNVGTKNGDYPIFESDQFDLNDSKVRSAGSAFARRDFDYNKQSYATVQYALEGVLPDEDESKANDDGISDATGAIAQKLQRDLMVGHELRVSTAMSGASFGSITPGNGSLSNAAATPIKDVQNAVEELNSDGFFGLTLVIEHSLYNAFLNSDEVRAIYSGSGLYLNKPQLQDALGVDNIIICPTRYNSAKKGQSASRSRIWSNTEYYVAQIAGGEFSNGGIGRTLAYSPDGGAFTAETYRDEPIKSDVLRVYMSTDEVIINTNAGRQIASTV
jgi:hypothetical protein|tara:strand:+ start:1510 stop:2427 length:918 start_codon:yes stop_codon:yes gene_type:complete